ncbi:hypothetical protein BCR43DRAFT_484774 [Syncephalastrum racemosum]|uniref:Uncharacterized protein n=1 Tax=Syncephalastrum racemosum TaxID=13706 RepID=A0A1X2HL75_SYNRA|nr:hypothetical protein BCR43DRAFT_484774 [Syncephalastrum racemosum]
MPPPVKPLNLSGGQCNHCGQVVHSCHVGYSLMLTVCHFYSTDIHVNPVLSCDPNNHSAVHYHHTSAILRSFTALFGLLFLHICSFLQTLYHTYRILWCSLYILATYDDVRLLHSIVFSSS